MRAERVKNVSAQVPSGWCRLITMTGRTVILDVPTKPNWLQGVVLLLVHHLHRDRDIRRRRRSGTARRTRLGPVRVLSLSAVGS
jgi:hypothetical protein